MKAVITVLSILIVYALLVFYFSGNVKVQEVDYYPGKYKWKCNTDIECFEEEQACLASGACVRQR